MKDLQITKFSASNNRLNNSALPKIVAIPQLEDVDISQNRRLNGSVPSAWKSKGLQRLTAHNCSFTRFPTVLKQLASVRAGRPRGKGPGKDILTARVF